MHLYIIMARAVESSVPDRTNGPQDSAPVGVGERLRRAIPAFGSLPKEPTDSLRGAAPDSGPSAPNDHGRDSQNSSPTSENADYGAAVEQEADKASPAPTEGNGPGEHPSGPQDDIRTDGGTPAPQGPKPGESDPGAATVTANVVKGGDEEPSAPVDGNEPPQDREEMEDWIREVLPVARNASRQAGRVSRDAIKDAVRARYPISNDRLGELVAVLRQEREVQQPPAVNGSRPLW